MALRSQRHRSVFSGGGAFTGGGGFASFSGSSSFTESTMFTEGGSGQTVMGEFQQLVGGIGGGKPASLTIIPP
ncbi:hypothetical protein NUW54_g14194 [Trametes sanguinea]|uniref:Uncharacterized protein n=1 Tax=Trametes sanguinea TaxID=158606 RepID=A0ACC1MEF4_9APHY|nr:hypothetical protein NUW54_g14194 [Trametes sanguinea]